MKKIKEKVFVNKEEKNKALKNNFKRMQYWQWMYSYVLECVHNQIEFKLELNCFCIVIVFSNCMNLYTVSISKSYEIREPLSIWEATYIYIEKSASYDFQRATYSQHKHRSLLKFMVVVAN